MKELIIVLVLLGICIQSIFIVFEHKEKYILAVILKGLASCMFISIGILGYINAINRDFSLLVLLGLILGGIGDVLLNLRFVFKKISSIVFLMGVASFLIGHILYLSSLISLSSTLFYSIPVGALIAFCILFVIFKKLKVKLSYKIFGILYIGAVCLMMSVAIFNVITISNTNSWLYAIGAVLFTVSDVVLIFNSFGPKQLFAFRITNLSLYYIGQLLIAISLFFI